MSIRISETTSQIEKKIRDAAMRAVNGFILKSIPQLEAEISNIIAYAIENSPEYYSLVNGKLKIELGLPDAHIRMGTVMDVWKASVRVNTDGKGGITISAIKSDYSDVLRLPDSYLVSESGNLPWLQWLLVEGNQTIITDYRIMYGNHDNSRTGGGIMVPRGNWNIPSEFSGVPGDNFVTRSLLSVDERIRTAIIKEIKKHVR